MTNDILQKSMQRALYGGFSGFCAMGIQVTSLMWLRTTMNYQYKYGGTILETLRLLYRQGGIFRFYRGYPYAIVLGPISRFGDTAANTFVNDYLRNSNVPIYLKTLCGSVLSTFWRVSLMPLDTMKTTLQVDGPKAFGNLKYRVKKHGVRTLFNGTSASLVANFVGHYPWFLTYNYLNATIPNYESSLNLVRNGGIGFVSAVTSDCCSNAFRVLKTSRQTSLGNDGYVATAKDIINKEGIAGLMGRGLKTRIITNGLQGIMFNITWKYIESELIKID